MKQLFRPANLRNGVGMLKLTCPDQNPDYMPTHSQIELAAQTIGSEKKYLKGITL